MLSGVSQATATSIEGVSTSKVRIWQVELDPGEEDEARLGTELASGETARVEGFANARSRRRFVVARGTLRMLLGSLLDKPPRSIQIDAGPSGKPCLAGAERLRFNVSHSGDLALICIADGFEVGIDLEFLRPVPSAVTMARRHFAPAEARFVESGTTAVDVDRRFLTCWTYKEALVKATGAGLNIDLRSFSVPLDSSSGVVSINEPGKRGTQRWLLADVPLGAGHVAALAVPAGVPDGDGAIPQPVAMPPSAAPDHCEEIEVSSLISRAIG